MLVGGNGTWRVLSAEPMLASRIFRRVRFQALTRPEICGHLTGYHPLYETVDPELIGWIDDVFAHGNLRHWAAFTLSATALAKEAGRQGLDEQIARNASRCTPVAQTAEQQAITLVLDPDDDLTTLRALRAARAAVGSDRVRAPNRYRS